MSKPTEAKKPRSIQIPRDLFTAMRDAVRASAPTDDMAARAERMLNEWQDKRIVSE